VLKTPLKDESKTNNPGWFNMFLSKMDGWMDGPLKIHPTDYCNTS